MRSVAKLLAVVATTSICCYSKRLEFGGHDKFDMALQRRSKINDSKHLKSTMREELDVDFDMLQALGQDGNAMQQIKDQFAGIAPIFGKNLLSVLATDVVNMFVIPAPLTTLQLFVDILYFILVPILGGILSASATYHWNFDELTYIHANMTQADLWQPTMDYIKFQLYGLLGRPMVMDLTPNTTSIVPSTGDPYTDEAINSLVNNTITTVDIIAQNQASDPWNPFS